MRHQAYGTVGKLLVGLVLVMAAIPNVGEAQTTTRVSVAMGGGQANDRSEEPALSSDGRVVAFESDATDLVPGDTNNTSDIFVHDRQTGTTTRVNVATGGEQGNGESEVPAISSDGRFVAFESSSTNLVPGNTNNNRDCFVHDRQTEMTTQVNVATGGGQGNSGCSDPTLSADGRFVAFESNSTNLVLGDTNNIDDIFVHDRQTGTTTRVSVATGGGQANGGGFIEGSQNPVLSADGRFVAFESDASNLVPNDTNGNNNPFDGEDIFVHDRQTGETTRVSVATGGEQGNDTSGRSTLSADGRFVAFHSWATNLVPNDTNGNNDPFVGKDIFVHDRQTGETTRVSVATGGGQGNAGSGRPTLSAGGRFVVFNSDSTNLVPGDMNNSKDVFIHDRQTGVTTRVSVAIGGGQGNAGSGDTTALSADGRVVAFDSSASNLVPGDTNGVDDIFVHDRGPTAVSNPDRPDVNGDGRADLVWRNTSNGATMVWQMTAAGLRGPITFPGGMPSNWVIQDVADVTGDGRADLVWRNTSNGATMIWQMTAAGLRGPITFAGGMPSNWEIRNVADVNGDGRADLVWRNTTNGATMVWAMTADARRGAITFPGSMPVPWAIKGVADVNGDGRADLVWRNTTNGATMVWQMTAAGLRGPITFAGGMPLNWEIQDVADVNGDGRADLVWRNTSNGATMVWAMTAAGLRGPIAFAGGMPLNWEIRNVADVTGDGRADLVWRNTANGATMVWQMTAGALRGPITFPGGMPTNWAIQAVADVNGDGRADLVWRNTTNGATMMWQMTAGALRGPITFAGGMPLNWVIQDAADVNGGGRADLVWRNTSNGATMIWQMTAGALRGPITFAGGMPLNWVIKNVADVNGDGRADLAWRNTSNGATMVWQMTAAALRGPITFPGGMPLVWALQP